MRRLGITLTDCGVSRIDSASPVADVACGAWQDPDPSAVPPLLASTEIWSRTAESSPVASSSPQARPDPARTDPRRSDPAMEVVHATGRQPPAR